MLLTRWRSRNPDPLTEAKVFRTLLKLDWAVDGFDHTNFDETDLHAAMQDYLDIEIRPDLIRSDAYEVMGRHIRRSPCEAELIKVEGSDHVSIEIPATTPTNQWRDLFYHELWHLMAAHPLPFWSRIGTGHAKPFWNPSRRLLARTPPFDLVACAADRRLARRMVAWCEVDADYAVEHLRTISALGERLYGSPELLMGLG